MILGCKMQILTVMQIKQGLGCDSIQFWPRGGLYRGNLAPSSSFSFPACYSQVFKQVLVFIQNFQGSKALQETFFRASGACCRLHCPCISHSMPFLPQASAASAFCFTFRTTRRRNLRRKLSSRSCAISRHARMLPIGAWKARKGGRCFWKSPKQ